MTADSPQTVTTPAVAVPSPIAESFGWMRSEFDRLLSGVSPLHDIFRLPVSLGGAPMPAVEVTETDVEYKLCIEVPGMDAKDVAIEVSGDRLRISGEKRSTRNGNAHGWHVSERSYGSFDRWLRLPPGVDTSSVKATASNGVITLVLPRNAGAATRRQIEIAPA